MKSVGKIIGVAVAALLVGACGTSDRWTLRGQVEGADSGTRLYVEGNNNGRWYTVDSVEVAGSGRFSVEGDAAGYPDIYRLRMGERFVYFPIDSVETVALTTTAEGFEANARLSGSASADEMNEAVTLLRGDSVSADAKRRLAELMLANPSGIVAYYVINARKGGRPVFDHLDRQDVRLVGLVANAYTERRPTDPRTKLLQALFLNNRAPSAVRDTLYANELSHFDIRLWDNHGQKQSLSGLKGKTVVLNFTAYEAQESPAFNRALNDVYRTYHPRGLEIFQVSVDENEPLWREAAEALPWITVYNPAGQKGVRNLLNYNVTEIPATFIINADGDLVERVDDIAGLGALVAKHLR